MRDGWTIREVSRQTGLSIALIRQWESRYGVVRPKRLPNGYRVYTSQDVERLRAVAAGVRGGLRTGEAVRRIQDRPAVPAPPAMDGGPPASDWVALQRKLLDAGAHMRPQQIRALLRLVSAQVGVNALIAGVLRPALVTIGERWATGVWREAQEQVTSEAVRTFLLEVLGDVEAPMDRPLILSAPVAGDRHDLPVIMTAISLATAGWRVHLLGPSPAPGAILSAVQQVRPWAAIIVATASARHNRALLPFRRQELPKLAACVPPERLLVGGAGWLRSEQHEPASWTPTPEAARDAIARWR